MAIETAHSYLVHPGKAASAQPAISATTVSRSDRLFELLTKIYDGAPAECKIDISFQADDSGHQVNDRCSQFDIYLTKPTLARGRAIAEELQLVTTNRSKLGLLFLVTGTEKGQRRLVVSRFPADEGIVAQEHKSKLSVEFIERIFMKNSHAYKSACCQVSLPHKGLWRGKAIDHQISGGQKEISDYWVREFLLSELSTTSAAGTRRAAKVLREAIRSSDDLDVRQELIAAAMLMRGQDGRVVSVRSICSGLGLSEVAMALIDRKMPAADLANEQFAFSSEEFDKHLRYRAVELDNGAVLMAEADRFDDVFSREELDGQGRGMERFWTEGRVEDERVRQTK